MWVVTVLVAILGLLMVVAPEAVASTMHTLRISSPAADSAGRVANATRVVGVALLGLAVILVALSLFY